MSAKHQPAGAFVGRKLAKAPDADAHPLAPKTPPPAPAPASAPEVKLTQFSARIDPELLRQVKIAAVTRGTTLQDAAAEAFRLWLDQD